VTEKTNTVKR